MLHVERPHPSLFVLRMRTHRTVRRIVVGSALVLFGAGSLLASQGLIARHDLWLIAPAALVLSALARLVLVPGAASLVRAIARCLIAAYLVVVIEHVGGWTFHDTWPVLLIAAGMATIARGLFDRRAQEPNW